VAAADADDDVMTTGKGNLDALGDAGGVWQKRGGGGGRSPEGALECAGLQVCTGESETKEGNVEG
jgi:hypothetical protein